MTQSPKSSGSLQIACFHVGGHEYGVDIMQIKEIINPIAVTPVPRAPAFIEGIIELRGAILPVVDLRKRFGVEVTPVARETKYIIVPLDGHIVGLVVDRVPEVMPVHREEVHDAPRMALGPDSRFFWGVFKKDDRMIMLVDVAQVLSPDEKAELAGLRDDDAETVDAEPTA